MVVNHKSSKSIYVCAVDEISDIDETKKPNGFGFSMLMAIADIIRFFIFAKITKWWTFFEKREKTCFSLLFAKKNS